jgi:hypothetical protein
MENTIETTKVEATKMKTKKKFIKNQSGVVLVEFGIILPLLLLFIFGTIEFSLLLFNQHMITNASREGARAGVIVRNPTRLSDTEIQAVVNNFAQQHLITFGNKTFPPAVISPVESLRTGYLFGTELSVSVSFDYEFLFLSNLGFGKKTLSATTVMRME